MMLIRQFALFCTCALVLSGCAQTPPEIAPDDFAEIRSSSLRKFASDEELAAYTRRVWELADKHDLWWASLAIPPGSAVLAQAQSEPDCDPDDESCDALEEITVSGSRVASNPSITNNQEAGVDEGDIVKRYKNFLIMLQDGRLFSVDMGDSVAGMRFVDRIDVYISTEDWAWYDELLISGNKLVVTGYSYAMNASEISVFEIDDAGIFTWLTTYHIVSEDYYSSHNYATRMVDDHLVIYTPMYLNEYTIDEGIIFPLYRQHSRDGQDSLWRPLFGATDVFWPIQDTLAPVIHTISVCPISKVDGLACRSTGIIGPGHREFYVSEEHAYIWNAQDSEELWELDYFSWGDDCDFDALGDNYQPLSAALYRIPLFEGETTAVKSAGVPIDQFSLDARERVFHALLAWPPNDCWADEMMPVRLLSLDYRQFSKNPAVVPVHDYTVLPAMRGYWPQNRFTENHVAYSDNPTGLSYVITAQLDNPGDPTRLPLGFEAGRLEVFGSGLVAAGSLEKDGLHVSTIALGDSPRIADREFVPGYFETEGRSHAFNLQVDERDQGIFGIPVAPSMPGYRWHYLRDNSDINFFSVGASMTLSNSGMLTSSTEPDNDDYECEVSCYDWYGNARPIFIDERIFALSGSEIIEGAMIGGQVAEVGRLSLTSQPANVRSESE